MILKKVILTLAITIILIVILSYRFLSSDSTSIEKTVYKDQIKGRVDMVKGVATSPGNGSDSVLLNKAVTVVFNKKMNPLTIDKTTFTLEDSVSVAGKVSYNGYIATFISSKALAPNTIYTATVTVGARSERETPLTTEYVWTFTTGGQSVIKSNNLSLRAGRTETRINSAKEAELAQSEVNLKADAVKEP